MERCVERGLGATCPLRWHALTMILAGWLLFTAVEQVHRSTPLALHDAVLAVAIFVVALVPGRLPPTPERVAA